VLLLLFLLLFICTQLNKCLSETQKLWKDGLEKNDATVQQKE